MWGRILGLAWLKFAVAPLLKVRKGLLAHESRDLPQAETKKVLLKAEQIHKTTNIFTQDDDFFQT